MDLNEIVERTLALRSYELRVENIMVECDLALNLPETMADPYQLQQVVLNLLVNAEQAVLEDRGQGHLDSPRRIGENPIPWKSPMTAREFPGKSPRASSILFHHQTVRRGTGLGLSIVYGIVEQHGGEVTSKIDRGRHAILVELPVIAVPAGKGYYGDTGNQIAASAPGGFSWWKMSPPWRNLSWMFCVKRAIKWKPSSTAKRANAHFARALDLVICDLRMPRVDGPAFYDALVRTGSSAQDRIMFVTGDTLAPRTLQFLEKSGLPYLSKPFLVEELKLAVSRRLERSRHAAKSAGSAGAHKSRATGRRS